MLFIWLYLLPPYPFVTRRWSTSPTRRKSPITVISPLPSLTAVGDVRLIATRFWAKIQGIAPFTQATHAKWKFRCAVIFFHLPNFLSHVKRHPNQWQTERRNQKKSSLKKITRTKADESTCYWHRQQDSNKIKNSAKNKEEHVAGHEWRTTRGTTFQFWWWWWLWRCINNVK